jgi:hypothetical protein
MGGYSTKRLAINLQSKIGTTKLDLTALSLMTSSTRTLRITIIIASLSKKTFSIMALDTEFFKKFMEKMFIRSL